MSIELGLHSDLDEAVYHGDLDSISSTGAKRLIASTPEKFDWERRHPVRKDVFEFGKAAHRMVLGAGADIAVVDATNWRSAAARAERDALEAEGKTVLLPDDYEVVVAMSDKIRAHPIAGKLFNPEKGAAEQSVFWHDEKHGVTRRARFDWLPNTDGGRLIIPDYKTATDANPANFDRSAASFGYHQQDAWYCAAAQAVGLAQDVALFFVVQEKTPPYAVSTVQLDAGSFAAGQQLNQKALRIFAECSATNTWPGYPLEVVQIGLPGYYLTKIQETL